MESDWSEQERVGNHGRYLCLRLFELLLPVLASNLHDAGARLYRGGDKTVCAAVCARCIGKLDWRIRPRRGGAALGPEVGPASCVYCRTRYRIGVRLRSIDQREQIRSACVASVLLRGNYLSAADRLGHLRRHWEAVRRRRRRLQEYGGRGGRPRFISDIRIFGSEHRKLRRRAPVDGGDA